MLIDFSKQILSLDGKPVKFGENDKQATLGKVCIEALSLNHHDEQNLSGEEKMKRYLLARRIYAAAPDIELKSEEIAELKKLTAKILGPIHLGPVWQYLEGEKVDEAQS